MLFRSVAVCIAVLVFALTCIGLMYYIHSDYQESLQGDRAHIEFKKKFNENSKEIECYEIFQQTGYLPKYCPS